MKPPTWVPGARPLASYRRHGSTTTVSLVGTLPDGFPSPCWPNPVSDLPLLVAGALGIALVSLTDTISTASAFGARTGQEVDGNKEMIGIGAAKLERYELIGPLNPDHFFPTLDAAVEAYREQSGADWTPPISPLSHEAVPSGQT